MIKSFLFISLLTITFGSSAIAQSAVDLTISGDTKLKAKDNNGAIADYTAAIKKNEAAALDFIKKNEQHQKMTAYEVALADNGRAPEPKVEWAAPYYGRGMAQKELSNKEDALKDFETAISLNWKLGEAYYERAFMKYPKEDKDHQCMDLRLGADCGCEKARVAYEDNFCWNNSISHYKEGTTKLNIKSYDEAIVEFDIAIKINPDSANIYVKRGMCYFGLTKNEKAMEDYNTAIKKDEKNVDAHYNLGLVYQAQDMHQKAFDEFAKVIALNPNHYEAFLHRALSCESQGQFASAIYDYSAAIRIHPKIGENFYKRGLLKRDNLKNENDACEDFCKASDLGFSDADDLAKDCRNPNKKKKKD